MSSLLVKRFSSFSPSSVTVHHHHLALLTPLLRLSISLSTQPPEQNEIPLVAKYLISSLGFSHDRALKVSAHKLVAAINVEDQPESVVKFLKDTGLSDTQIRCAISFRPDLLSYNVQKTLKPKVCELIDGGFSGELVVELIRYNPAALLMKDTLSHLLFWRDFVGNSDQGLLNIIQKNGLLITYDVDKHVVPRINLLNEYGFSNRDIATVLASGHTRSMSRSLDSSRHSLEFIEALGIPRGSRMFLVGFKATNAYNRGTIERKVEFFKMTYGWSQEDVSSAFKKFPFILALSVDKIKSNMDFCIRMGKLEPRTIVSNPSLLAYSLDKRLVPRHHVLSILAAKGLKKKLSLVSVCQCTDKIFLEKYINPYKKDVPELADVYLAASAGNIPV